MNRRSIPLLSMIEKGTSGTTMLFLHGSSLSSESFKNQLNEPLTNYLYSLQLTNLWQKQPVSIKDACHVPHMEKPEEFNSQLYHFVQSLL